MANLDKKQTQEIMEKTLPPLETIQQELGNAKISTTFSAKRGSWSVSLARP